MPSTPRTRAEDAATYYESDGEGRPLVFIHGGWSSSAMWAPQVERFAPEYRTITYDVRGHGRTTDAGSEPYSIGRFVEDLRALLDTLDADRPILCGLSMGGIIAQTYAASYPEDVTGLVLADTTRWIPPLPIALSGYQKRTLFPKPVVHSYIRAIGVEAYFRQLLAGIQAMEGHQWLALDPEVRAFAISEIAEFDVESYLRVFDALYDFEGCDLDAITAPTLVLAGDHEAGAVREQSERMATIIDDATLGTIPDAGHLANLDNPSAFNGRIADFLGERVEQ